MPSVSKPQATLMAMAAHNPAFAKRKGIPVKAAREFNRADQRTGILRKGRGGRSQSGMDAKTNFGQGRGKSMFSTMPLLGHAMSGTQLGEADALVRRAQAAFADGGAVKKDTKSAKPQMSAKERREVRGIIERGKNDAVSALRDTRQMLIASLRSEPDLASRLEGLHRRLQMKDGGAVDDALTKGLLADLEDETDQSRMMELVDQIVELEKSAPKQSRVTGTIGPIERTGLLHRGLGAYADLLGSTAQKVKSGGDWLARSTVPVNALMGTAIQDAAGQMQGGATALNDWSQGFAPIRATPEGGLVRPSVNREQLVDAVGGLAPLATVARSTPGAVRDAARDFMGAQVRGMPRITAYHGSKYDFDRFDPEKIGTGEGAQAYGYGLYFAENPRVAKEYQQKLGAGRGAGKDDVMARILEAAGGDRARAAQIARERAGYSNIEGAREKFEAIARDIEAGVDPRGRFYHVDLPDKHIDQMLDLDKPLGEQSESIREAWIRAMQQHMGRTPQVDMSTLTGAQAYNMLSGGASGMHGYEKEAAAASRALKRSGIPGLKYFDQASRSTGEGTRNFVVFDDDIVKVLKKE